MCFLFKHIANIRTINTTARFSMIWVLKICATLNKEKIIATLRWWVTMWTIRTMKWYFHIADYCISLLAFPNNREFAQSNRVYGHFCWNYFWEILSYSQREFWRMWNPQNRPINITDKTFIKALVKIFMDCYNFLSYHIIIIRVKIKHTQC